MVFSVSGLRRGVRRCLNGRHARAGRSPRASEVGAREEPEGLTAGARVTRWRAVDGRRVVVVDGADADPCGGRRAAAERAAVVYRVVVQLGQAAWRSDGLRLYGRGGLTARRAEAVVIVTGQGQDPAGGLVAAGDRARAAPGGTAHNRLSTPQWLFRRNLAEPSASNHRAPPRPRTMRQEGRSPLRQGAGGLRGSRSQPAPALCDVANGVAPPAPGGQRGAACVVSRVRARRSRAPWRPLTRLRRRWRCTRQDGNRIV